MVFRSFKTRNNETKIRSWRKCTNCYQWVEIGFLHDCKGKTMITDAGNKMEIDSLNGLIAAIRGKNGKPTTRERAFAIQKLQEAAMWLEQDAKVNKE